MKKRILSILLVFSLMLCAMPMNSLALETVTGNFEGFEYKIGNTFYDDVVITGYTGDATELVVPAQIEGQPVTTIDPCAFMNHTDITSVVLPEGLKAIYQDAFKNCLALEDVNLPKSLQFLDAGLFEAMSIFTNEENWEDDALYIGTVLYKVRPSVSGEFRVKDGTTCIASTAFMNCTSLTDVYIPDGPLEIGAFTFRDCTSLKSVRLPSTLIEISASEFRNCTALQSIMIPIGTETIVNNAFFGCSGLTSITILDSVKHIGDWAFDGSENVTIYGYAGSYAETYANENEIPFVALLDDPVTPPEDPDEPVTPPEELIIGDIDGGGSVDVADIMKIKDLIMKETATPELLAVGDLNGSGSFDVGDIMALKALIMAA